MGLFGSMGKEIFKSIKIKKRVFDPEKMSIEDISLPVVLRNLNSDNLTSVIADEISTFKSLGYKDKPLEQVKAKEYHSYQVGVLLKYLKDDKSYSIPKIETILPSFILGSSKKQLHIKVFDIVFRYDNSVEKDASVEELVRDIRWTPNDVAYLLYYISLEDRVIPKR
ncbi:MAG: hypothetical protein U9R16_04250 [Campylobacterota bacterium]|nr:hypothetical protein [Campylobacterota bacterium]